MSFPRCYTVLVIMKVIQMRIFHFLNFIFVVPAYCLVNLGRIRLVSFKWSDWLLHWPMTALKPVEVCEMGRLSRLLKVMEIRVCLQPMAILWHIQKQLFLMVIVTVRYPRTKHRIVWLSDWRFCFSDPKISRWAVSLEKPVHFGRIIIKLGPNVDSLSIDPDSVSGKNTITKMA